MINWEKPIQTKNGRNAILTRKYRSEGNVKHWLVGVTYSGGHITDYEYNEDGTFPNRESSMLDLVNV